MRPGGCADEAGFLTVDPTTYGWLVLAFPLAGSVVIGLGYRVLPGRSAGWIGTVEIFAAFL